MPGCLGGVINQEVTLHYRFKDTCIHDVEIHSSPFHSSGFAYHAYMHPRTYAHTHACVHTCLHACMNACPRAYKTDPRTRSQRSSLHPPIHLYQRNKQTCMHAYIHKSDMPVHNKHAYIDWHTCLHVLVCTCMHTCVRERHACMHACIHT